MLISQLLFSIFFNVTALHFIFQTWLLSEGQDEANPPNYCI